MSARRSARVLAAAVAVAGLLLLAGCEPATGQQGGSFLSGGCDPHGFGPFSGCGGTGSTGQVDEPASATGGCDPNGFGPLSGCSGQPEDQGDGEDGSADFAPDDEVTPEDMADSARHEAWHKAVADCDGWHVVSSEIYPNGDGLTTVDVPIDAPLRQKLALFMAGSAADGVDDNSLEDGSFDDLRQAAHAMGDANIPPADRDQLLAEASDAAKRCAATRQAQIVRDTADLLDNGRLG